MASRLLVVFLLLISLCAVVSVVHSSRPIADGMETIWSSAAAEAGDGGAARSLPERAMIAVLPRTSRREPMFRPPPPKGNMRTTSYMPPCSAAGPGCLSPGIRG